MGVGAVADGDAHRVALLLEHLAHGEELGPGLGVGVAKARLLEVGHVVGGGERHPEPRHRLPAARGLAHLGAEGVPAAVLLAQLVHHVVDVGVQVLVEEGVGAGRAVHVVAGLRLCLGGDLGRHLQMRHGIHAHGAVVGLGEGLRLLAELVVRGGHEVVPGEEGQLALLGERRGLAESEPGGHPGRRAGGGAEELAALRAAGSGLIHEGLRIGTEVSGHEENLAGLGLTPSGEALPPA